MKLIITHGGQAHRDDFVACCIALARNPRCAIERRDPTTQELRDYEVLVLDVGLLHFPAQSCFDHHQCGRESEATCALSLYLKSLHDGKLYDAARRASPWLYATEVLDSRGPFELVKQLGISRDALAQLLSPIEAQLLRQFGACERVSANSVLHYMMREMGNSWLQYWEDFSRRWARLVDWAQSVRIDGVPGVALPSVSRDAEPTLALEQWCLRLDEATSDPARRIAFTVTQDDRGDGWCLFRRNDDPRVDFSRVEGDPAIVFAHKNGFVAKTTAGADWVDLVRRSLVSEEEVDHA